MSRRQQESELPLSLIERGRKKAAAAGVVAALGLGALAGCATNAEAEGPAPTETTQSVEQPTPTETTPAPTETETSPSGIESVPEGEFDITKEMPEREYGLTAEMSPDELANEIEAIRKAWVFHGSTSADEAWGYASNDAFNKAMGIQEYNDYVAADAAAKYAPSLFGENWDEYVHSTEAETSGVGYLFETLTDGTRQNFINASSRGAHGEEAPTFETTVSNASNESTIRLESGESVLSYDVHFDLIRAENAETTDDAKLYFHLMEQPDGSLIVKSMSLG